MNTVNLGGGPKSSKSTEPRPNLSTCPLRPDPGESLSKPWHRASARATSDKGHQLSPADTGSVARAPAALSQGATEGRARSAVSDLGTQWPQAGQQIQPQKTTPTSGPKDPKRNLQAQEKTSASRLYGWKYRQRLINKARGSKSKNAKKQMRAPHLSAPSPPHQSCILKGMCVKALKRDWPPFPGH